MAMGLGAEVPKNRASLESERAFLAISALLFLASVGAVIYYSRSSMSSGMPMAEQPWFNGTAPFMGQWIVMMGAMMLPSLVFTLLSFRQFAHRRGESRLARLTLLAGAGYFFVWAGVGAVAYLPRQGSSFSSQDVCS
jgi:Predicted metal-binding integral membrane protein (DUF2182)